MRRQSEADAVVPAAQQADFLIAVLQQEVQIAGDLREAPSVDLVDDEYAFRRWVLPSLVDDLAQGLGLRANPPNSNGRKPSKKSAYLYAGW